MRERVRLQEYLASQANRKTVAVSNYSRAVEVLSEWSGVLLKTEYVRIRDLTDKARVAAELARRNFDEHVAQHGC